MRSGSPWQDLLVTDRGEFQQALWHVERMPSSQMLLGLAVAVASAGITTAGASDTFQVDVYDEGLVVTEGHASTADILKERTPHQRWVPWVRIASVERQPVLHGRHTEPWLALGLHDGSTVALCPTHIAAKHGSAEADDEAETKAAQLIDAWERWKASHPAE